MSPERYKLGFLGPPGSFGEQAALRYDPNANGVPFDNHASVLKALVANQVERVILPVENSLEGSVMENIDGILREEQPQHLRRGRAAGRALLHRRARLEPA